MTIAKALKGAGDYSIVLVLFGAFVLYPQLSLLEMQLSIILVMAVLIFVSHFVTWIRKWLNFGDIVSLLVSLPLVFYVISNDLDLIKKTLLAVFTLGILIKLSTYIISKLRIFSTDEDLLPFTTQKLAIWLLAWAGTTSFLATLGYLLYGNFFLRLTNG